MTRAMKLEEAIQTNGFESAAHKAAVNLMFVAYHVKTFVSQRLKTHDLTPEQYNVLRILKGKHPQAMCVKDVNGRMIERSSNVPRIIDRLVQKQLVERSQSGADRRETNISLTQNGLDRLLAVKPSMERINQEMSSLPEADLNELNNLLDRYLN
jgi:DNA-binding MarR family transcriptional regulator